MIHEEEEQGPSLLTAALEGPRDDAAAAPDLDLMDTFMLAVEADDDDDVAEGVPFVPSSFFGQEENHGRFFEREENYGRRDDDNDFFAENYEETELPDHMKDQYLENFGKQLDENMTLQQFEKSQLEVHGISTNSLSLDQKQPQNPRMIEKALLDLDMEITRLHQEDFRLTDQYRTAASQSSEFVTNRKFRLLFLRSESFNVAKAAYKLMRHFQLKEEYWGRDKLTKKITLSDFDEHDYECLKNGHVQLLPIRDHAGRSVILNNLNHLHYCNEYNQLRVVWYLIFVALEDEDTQKNGMVWIQYKVGERKGHRPNRQLLWKGTTTTQGLPISFGAFHLCFGRQSLPFVWLLKLALEYQTSHRVRVHEGSQTEVLNTLMTFGIPRYAVPISVDGQVTTNYHLDWLDKRLNVEKRAAEENDNGSSDSDDTSSSFVRVPGNCDVLLGRGKRAQFHPGNIRYNMLLEEKSHDYDNCNRKAKQAITLAIIHQIQVSFGGRFLRCVDKTGLWEVVNEKDIAKKISHDFRTVRQKKLSNKSNTEELLVEPSHKKRAPDMQLSSKRQARPPA